MSLYKNSGFILIGIGVIHNVFGLVFGWNILFDMHQAGWIGSTMEQGKMLFERESIIWFLFSGCCLMMIGALVQHLLKHHINPPVWFGYALMAIGGVLAFIMPESGVYLIIITGILMAVTGHNSLEEKALQGK